MTLSAVDGLLPPPWMRYPRIPMGSIGWRMGQGESYLVEWWDWLDSLSEVELQQYQGWFPPPPTFQEFYSMDYEFEYDEDFFCEHSGWSISFWERLGMPRYSRQQLIETGWDGEFVFFWKPNSSEVGPASLS
jgi:hypothetical protein